MNNDKKWDSSDMDLGDTQRSAGSTATATKNTDRTTSGTNQVFDNEDTE